MTTKFMKPKSIAELAEIAKSVRCTGIERDYSFDEKPKADYSYLLTIASEYGEITSTMWSNNPNLMPNISLNFSLIKSWERSIEYGSDSIKHQRKFTPLFGEEIIYEDILDILDYCNE